MGNNALNHAIVGCGVIGPTHAASIAKIPGSTLVAVCDTVKERADKLAAAYNAKAYTSLEEMLKQPDIDVVHVCVPSGDHANVGVIAAQAGKHIVVEKPIDISLEAADRLIDACAKAGVKLTCISQHRFDPDIAQLKKDVDDGKFGTINFGCSHTKWFRSQEYYDSGDWRGTWALDGGGALMNQSVHYVDMLQFLCGEVEEVMAYCATRTHERIEVEDCAAAAVKFKSGALGMIEGNTTANPGFATRLDVFGTLGGAIIENDRLKEMKTADASGKTLTKFVAAEGTKEEKSGAGSADIFGDSHTRQIANMVDAINNNTTPAVTGEAARKPLSIILSIYESAQTGLPSKVK